MTSYLAGQVLQYIYDQYTDSPDSYIEKGVFTKENSPPFDWTDIADQCPVTVDWLKKWPFEKLHRCRFMLLEPMVT